MATFQFAYTYNDPGFEVEITQTSSGRNSTFSVSRVWFKPSWYNSYLYGTISLGGQTILDATGSKAIGSTYFSSLESWNEVSLSPATSSPLTRTHNDDGSLSAMTLSVSFNVSNSSGSSNYGSVSGSATLTPTSIGAVTYTVSYNANGGTGAPAAQTKTYNVNLTLSSTTPTKSATTSTGYTVSFAGNGGSPSKSSATATNTTTYPFNSWNTASNGTGTSYAAGQVYTGNAALTLYAQYGSSTSLGAVTTATASRSNTTTSRTVSFDATTNGGTSNPSSQKSAATVSYSPTGWYTSGGTYAAAIGGSYTPSSNITLYAYWSPSVGSYSAITLPTASKNSETNIRTVTFDANGGTCDTESLQSSSTTSYSLKGWYTSSSGGTSRGTAGASYVPSQSENLFAQFSSSSTDYTSIALPTPTRPGYKFLGWATEPTATSGSTGSYVPSDSMILYAIWAIQGNVRIKDSNGEHLYFVMIYTSNGWKMAIPYVYTGSQWRQCGG